jgi:hypothetical protein
VQDDRDLEAIKAALAAPFDPAEVRFRPAAVSGHRALAVAYVDVRAVEDRLDEVLGVDGWQDGYEPLEGGCVLCRLKVRLNGRWLVKSDAGVCGDLPDEGDRRKGAFSQALKRAAVKWGVARYLARVEPQWVDYDPARERFVSPPRLPDWALPRPPSREFIGRGRVRRLLLLLALKGYGSRKLAERYGVAQLGQLSVEEYRHAAEHLSRLPDRVANC